MAFCACKSLSYSDVTRLIKTEVSGVRLVKTEVSDVTRLVKTELSDVRAKTKRGKVYTIAILLTTEEPAWPTMRLSLAQVVLTKY